MHVVWRRTEIRLLSIACNVQEKKYQGRIVKDGPFFQFQEVNHMKIPLHYQMTEFDCGPTALMNAVQFLFEGNEIPPDFPKKIMGYCLDGYDDNGIAYRTGTTKAAMQFLSQWFNQYSEMTGYPIRCEYLEKEAVTLNKDGAIMKALEDGGAVVIRCVFDVGHYITLTGLEGGYLKAWDPYYMDKKIRIPGVVYVEDQPKECNRLIRPEVMEQSNESFYAMDGMAKRNAVIFHKTGTFHPFMPDPAALKK